MIFFSLLKINLYCLTNQICCFQFKTHPLVDYFLSFASDKKKKKLKKHVVAFKCAHIEIYFYTSSKDIISLKSFIEIDYDSTDTRKIALSIKY